MMKNEKKPCIAALDVGTSSVKVCLFTPEMEMICRSVQEYAIDARGSWVEADGEIYLKAIRDGMKEAVQHAADYAVAAIGVTTQGETLVPVDLEGRPLRPFIVWLDDRAGEQAQRLKQTLEEMEFYRTTGLPEISGALPLAKLMWLRDEEPEIYRNVFT